ncbi:hypothetical protein [Saccharopolyspora gloriosae]|uniref:hypothetical protein n=1 Tax=Saccharopolyspora gloriosae TaxID=455344 RepID=UPI001FB73602|nr:hypothetical protein [Saccharopolyspora gloriosae]
MLRRQSILNRRSAVLACCGFTLLIPLLTSAYIPPQPAPPAPARDGQDIGWPFEHPALSLRTEVQPAAARPGDPITQTAVIGNTGDTKLAGIAVTLDSGPCHEVLGPLRPNTTRSVSCSGTAPADGRVSARAVGMTHSGMSAIAHAATKIAEPPAPELPSVSLEILPARAGTVPVRVRNTSNVPLLEVQVTGEPPACRRELGTLEPGRSVTYTCEARPGETVGLAVSARSLAGETTAADALMVMPVPPPPAAAEASPPAEKEPPPAARPVPPPVEHTDVKLADSSGPRESPAQTAGFIAVLGVLVMMVSVGALSTATRPGR